MEVAKTRLVLNKLGSDVPKDDVTPAEALLLHVLHGPNNGGKTFTEKMDNFSVVGQAMIQEGEKQRPRTDVEEVARLRRKYSQAQNKERKLIVDLLWPDKFNVKLPQTFKELKWTDIAQATQGIEVAALNYVTGVPVQTLSK